MSLFVKQWLTELTCGAQVFPADLVICTGPPQYQHLPQHIDFLFLELHVLFSFTKDGAPSSE